MEHKLKFFSKEVFEQIKEYEAAEDSMGIPGRKTRILFKGTSESIICGEAMWGKAIYEDILHDLALTKKTDYAKKLREISDEEEGFDWSKTGTCFACGYSFKIYGRKGRCFSRNGESFAYLCEDCLK